MKTLYFFTILLASLSTFVTAQSVCQEQLISNNGFTGTTIGQSIFMSGCSGFFNSIELIRSDDGAEIVADFTIFIGQTFLGTPLYTQTVTIPSGSGAFTIDFENGEGALSFFQDSQYTFMLSNASFQLEGSSDVDVYSDGQLFVDLGFINNDDLWFKLTTTSTLGIDNQDLPEVILFPNPAKDSIQLSGIYSPQTYTVYTSIGVMVMQGVATSQQSINIQSLPAGLYFLKLPDNKTMRFVKS